MYKCSVVMQIIELIIQNTETLLTTLLSTLDELSISSNLFGNIILIIAKHYLFYFVIKYGECFYCYTQK